MTTLTAKGLCLKYGARVISEALSVSFDRPEIVTIIGPNGSGKSTLLKALAHILLPAGGAVYLNGQDMKTMPRRERAQTMALLSQSLQAPGDMTARELAACGRIPYRERLSPMTEADRAAVDRALEAVGASHLAGRGMKELSGGERQRVWMAMALAQEPKILLLDEPTTYLDIRHQLELMKLITRLHEEFAITVIMVLHDLCHAARFSQRVLVMQGGRIVLDGTPDEVMTAPKLEPVYGVRMVAARVEKDGRFYPICLPCEEADPALK